MASTSRVRHQCKLVFSSVYSLYFWLKKCRWHMAWSQYRLPLFRKQAIFFYVWPQRTFIDFYTSANERGMLLKLTIVTKGTVFRKQKPIDEAQNMEPKPPPIPTLHTKFFLYLSVAKYIKRARNMKLQHTITQNMEPQIIPIRFFAYGIFKYGN